MLLKNNSTKKAYLILSCVLDNGCVRERSIENEEEHDFFAAQRIRFDKILQRQIVYSQGEHFSFSTDEIAELSEIKSQEEFAQKYFPDFELFHDEVAYRSRKELN